MTAMGIGKLFKGKKNIAVPAEALPETPVENRERENVSGSASNAGEIGQAVIEVLRTVYDPEIPVNIYELGLVYHVDVDHAGRVLVRMTLTSPGCPVAGSLIPEIENKVAHLPGVTGATVDLVWDPPWDPDMMSEAAKLQLGFF